MNNQTNKWFKTDNEILQFLINFFLLEGIGLGIVTIFCYLLRFFGMPQVYFYYHSHPVIRHIIFTLLLLIAISISVFSIVQKKRKDNMS